MLDIIQNTKTTEFPKYLAGGGAESSWSEQLDRAIIRRRWAKKAIKLNARRGSREIEWSVEAQTTSFYLNVLINFPKTKSLPKTK